MTTATSAPLWHQPVRRFLAALVVAVLPLALGVGPLAGNAMAAGPATFNAAVDYAGTYDTAGNKTAASCPLAADTGPHDNIVCTANAPYVITTADQTSGTVTQTATAGATGNVGQPVTSADATLATKLTAPISKITLDKRALLDDLNGNSKADVGETIEYEFVLTNPGNVTLTKVGVLDAKAGTVSCPSQTLAPQATETCKAVRVHTVTTADVAASTIVNRAEASGTDPAGTVVSAVDSVATPTHRDSTPGMTPGSTPTPTPGSAPDSGSQQPGLAWTGSPVLTLLGLAGAGLALGVLFLLAGLRRHREEQ